MTTKEYHETRVLPERKRSVKNGKRAIESFLKSCRDRTVVEHPEWMEKFDTDFTVRLMSAYFYLTKYLGAKDDINGYSVFCAAFNSKEGFYTDNVLDDNPNVKPIRTTLKNFLLICKDIDK